VHASSVFWTSSSRISRRCRCRTRSFDCVIITYALRLRLDDYLAGADSGTMCGRSFLVGSAGSLIAALVNASGSIPLIRALGTWTLVSPDRRGGHFVGGPAARGPRVP